MVRSKRAHCGSADALDADDASGAVQYFNATGKSLVVWRQQSVSLYHAARFLVEAKLDQDDEWRRKENAGAALMLGGFALETLFKMVIVGEHCERRGLSLTSRNAREFLPTSHDLVTLAKKAKIRTNTADREVLRKLAEYSVWAGRYPIPLTPDGFNGSFLSRLILDMPGEKSQIDMVTQDFVPLYQKLYPRARAKVFSERRRRAKSREIGPEHLTRRR